MKLDKVLIVHVDQLETLNTLRDVANLGLQYLQERHLDDSQSEVAAYEWLEGVIKEFKEEV